MESSIAMQDATHRRRTLLVELEFLLSSTEESGDEPGRTRACNPRLCRPMPYPLGHGASCFAAAGRARMARDSAAKLGNGSMTVRTCAITYSKIIEVLAEHCFDPWTFGL